MRGARRRGLLDPLLENVLLRRGVAKDRWAKVWYIGDPDQSRRIDVTSWFTAGEHALRLQAINTVGPASYGVRVWVDGAVALEVPCPAQVCNGGNAPAGIIFDRTLMLTTLGPPAQTVRVTSALPGKLYVDDAFTGLSTTGTAAPVSMTLPPGEHTIGLGVSDDVPPDYSGSYFERTVTLSDAASTCATRSRRW